MGNERIELPLTTFGKAEYRVNLEEQFGEVFGCVKLGHLLDIQVDMSVLGCVNV